MTAHIMPIRAKEDTIVCIIVKKPSNHRDLTFKSERALSDFW
jgi:hypothetical protein